MKTIFAILLFFLPGQFLLAQLNCKTTIGEDGSTLKQCFHKNGKISVTETWGKDKRFGTIKGFTDQGKELFSHSLRTVGGHASAQLTYFANGQVESIHYSDAPDGGIQFYNSDTRFDESGNQTAFSERKYPDRLEIEPFVRDTLKPRKPVVEVNRVLEKPSAKKQLQVVIENKSKSKVKVVVELLMGESKVSKTITLKAKECFLLDTQKFVPADCDVTKFVSVYLPSAKFEALRGQDRSDDEVLEAIWYIIKK